MANENESSFLASSRSEKRSEEGFPVFSSDVFSLKESCRSITFEESKEPKSSALMMTKTLPTTSSDPSDNTNDTCSPIKKRTNPEKAKSMKALIMKEISYSNRAFSLKKVIYSQLSSARVIEDYKDNKAGGQCMRLSKTGAFNLTIIGVPLFFTLVYAIAILFPPSARTKMPFLLWTDGELTVEDGQVLLCPRASICSKGFFQIFLIATARLTAFASYIMMAVTFMAKMHSSIHYLSSTYLSTFVPFEEFHHLHTYMGKIYGGLASLHTLAHLIRWGLRNELSFIVTTTVGLSGLFAIIFMIIVVFSMTLAKKWKTTFPFEKRILLHWLFTAGSFSILFHTMRCGIITSIFFCMWLMDYIYSFFFRTHRVDVAEFTPLPDNSGTQMLFRNPDNFKVRSGQYVQIKLPWLTEGGNEWHPFSVYNQNDNFMPPALSTDGLVSMVESTGGAVSESLEVREFTNSLLLAEFESYHGTDSVSKHDSSHLLGNSYHGRLTEATENISERYNTTQIFISPSGDWTKRVNKTVAMKNNTATCWVRGPYTSPYHIGTNFSHLILTATGIGITPALGSVAQFPGMTRTKILVWSVRCREMLMFFAPLLKDVHASFIFYTGKDEPLTPSEAATIRSYGQGNIYLKCGSSRGKFPTTLTDVLTEFESTLQERHFPNINTISAEALRHWCVMYCGGSKNIRDEVKNFCSLGSHKNEQAKIAFYAELFDW